MLKTHPPLIPNLFPIFWAVSANFQNFPITAFFLVFSLGPQKIYFGKIKVSKCRLIPILWIPPKKRGVIITFSQVLTHYCVTVSWVFTRILTEVLYKAL